MSTKRAEAEKLLTYYFQTAWTAAGVAWERDNTTEVAALTEALIEAAVERIDEREARRHK